MNTKIEKLTFKELRELFYAHNASSETPEPIYAVIVFTEDTWPVQYSLESRSYKVKSDTWGWMADKYGRAIYGDSLDGSDLRVRLDAYIAGIKEEEGWIVDYCYLLESEN